MIRDYYHNFGLPDITDSTTAKASTNIYDAGAAVILFASGRSPSIVWKTVITADASPTIKIDFVASADSDLDPNINGNLYEILGSTGVLVHKQDGTAISSGDTMFGSFKVADQLVARRYYGLIVTLGGTNPDIVAATSYAHLVLDPQTWMRGARAAIPA